MKRGFTLIEVTVAMAVLAVAATAVLSTLIGVQRAALEARRLENAQALLSNASERVRTTEAGALRDGASCPGVRLADYPYLEGYRCVVARVPGGPGVVVRLLDPEGEVYAATVGVPR